MAGLDLLDDGLWAWFGDPAGAGGTNAGLVADVDGLTLVDTLLTPGDAAPLSAAVSATGAGPLRRLVLTSSHVEHAGGSGQFRLPAVYGSPQVSEHLDLAPNVAGYRTRFPHRAGEFDDDFATRAVTHTVAEPAWLTQRIVAVPLAGQIRQNLVVVVPDSSLVFAGALCTFGATPLAFEGDPAAWATSLDELLELGIIVVPGQGPIGGEEEVRDLQAYLRACVAADGDPAAIPPGPWDEWSDRRWDVVNVERAALLAAGDDRVPPSMLRILGLA